MKQRDKEGGGEELGATQISWAKNLIIAPKLAAMKTMCYGKGGRVKWRSHKVETPIHDNIRELVTWECKEEHGVKS